MTIETIRSKYYNTLSFADKTNKTPEGDGNEAVFPVELKDWPLIKQIRPRKGTGTLNTVAYVCTKTG